jgi:hypothetical protein
MSALRGKADIGACPQNVRSWLIAEIAGRNSISDLEYEIEPASEAVASIRYPHQQFALE